MHCLARTRCSFNAGFFADLPRLYVVVPDYTPRRSRLAGLVVEEYRDASGSGATGLTSRARRPSPRRWP